MRVLVTILAISTVCLGVNALASGDAPVDRSRLKVEQRLGALELEVQYLRSREAATTAYVLRNQARGESLEALAKEVRNLGFETARIQISSRRALLAGLERMGKDIATDLPLPTPEEDVLLKQLEATLSR